MVKKLVEYIDYENDPNRCDIGIVFDFNTHFDVQKVMNPLIIQKDYFLICQVNSSDKSYIFYRVVNTERNFEIIEKIDITNRKFKIPMKYNSQIKNLRNSYVQLLEHLNNEKNILDVIKKTEEIYDSFIPLYQKLSVEG